jgi:lipopolysaccharide exporter
VLVVFSGTVVAKVLAVVAAPVLARLFAPEDFGVFGLFTSFVSVLVFAGSMGYSRAVVLPRSDRDAAGLLWLSAGILLTVTTIAGSLMWLLRKEIAQAVNAPAIAPLLGWIPAVLLATGGYQIFEMWSSRRKRFGQLASANISRSVGTVGTQLSAGFAGFAGGGLIGGVAIGQAIGAGVLGIQQCRRDSAMLKRGLHWGRIRALASRHRDFPLLSLPSNLLYSGANAAIPVLLSLFFGPAVVGLYWFGHRLIALATESLGQAVRRVFYQRASELHNAGQSVHRLFVRNTFMLFLLGVVPVLLIVIAGPPLFEFVFGSEWREAGVYARWLVVMGLALFLTAPATELIYIFELQRWLLVLGVLQFVAKVSSIVLGGLVGSAQLAIILLSGSMALIYCVHIAAITWYAKTRIPAAAESERP